jgi:hypothetical protein
MPLRIQAWRFGSIRNPRSLFGLQQALKAQDRNYDASFVESEFRDSSKGREVKIEDLV